MKRIFLSNLLLLLPGFCYASDCCSLHDFNFYLMGGVEFASPSNNEIVPININQINQYTTNSGTLTGPILGIGIAHNFILSNFPMQINLGLSEYYTYFGKISGIEYPFINDGVYDSLNYQFNAATFATMVESRFIYNQYAWQPFLLAGIGLAWNRLSNYSEKPTQPSLSAAATPSPFASKSEGAFAYELGIGIQREIYQVDNTIYTLALAYQYMNFGNAGLGHLPAPANNNRDSPHISSLDTNAVLLALNIAF